jgi:membrane fusion protein (multidrug efflux system)
MGGLLLGGFFLIKFFLSSPSAPPGGEVKVVEVETVALKSIQQTARLIGTLRPKRSATLRAKATGTFTSTLRPGQKASKGDLIAHIENVDWEKNYTLSESGEKIARTQYERESQLLKTGNSSKRGVEEKKNIWLEAQKNLAHAKIELDKIRFYAPFDGVLGVFKVREGTQVQEGVSVVSFYDPSQLIVEFDIPASLIHSIEEGQLVRIHGKEYPLSHFQKMIDEETHMCPAYVKIQGDNGVIGTTVDVDIILHQKKDVVVIPFEAIFLRAGKTFVYQVEEGKATLTPVELGVREKEAVEVTQGLHPGQVIIVKGHGRLYPGVSVKIYEGDRPVLPPLEKK